MKHRPLNSPGMQLSQKLAYEGTMNERQLQGNSYHGRVYQKITHVYLNDYQNLLYYRAIFGLSVYKQDEIKKMSRVKYNRILKVHRRTQKVLNTLKQKRLIAMSNQWFKGLCPKSPLTQELVDNHSQLEENAKINISFDVLKITKSEIIHTLVKEGILPNNFYNLKPVTRCK